MKCLVFDNGGTQFPTGHYNKCGKFKPRNFKVGTSAYKSLRNYKSIAELETDPVPDSEGEYTSEDEDDVPLGHLLTPTRPTTTPTNNDSPIEYDNPVIEMSHHSRYDNIEYSYLHHSTPVNSPPTACVADIHHDANISTSSSFPGFNIPTPHHPTTSGTTTPTRPTLESITSPTHTHTHTHTHAHTHTHTHTHTNTHTHTSPNICQMTRPIRYLAPVVALMQWRPEAAAAAFHPHPHPCSHPYPQPLPLAQLEVY